MNNLTENANEPVITEVTGSHAVMKSPSLLHRLEACAASLSTRHNFWHRLFSMIWLPYAFRSGVRLWRRDAGTFTAVLPFKRVNRNWYNAMAGAALLGNSEVAAGMFVFAECKSDFTVLCREMSYRFLRPCLGPAIYEVADTERVRKEIHESMSKNTEFNLEMTLDVRQILRKTKEKAPRVGRCSIVFHCTPREQAKEKAQARRRKANSR